MSILVLIIVLYLFYQKLKEKNFGNLYESNKIENNEKQVIQDIMKYGNEGDFAKLSKYINYPIRRDYPLPLIKDSSDFVKYVSIIWDDSLKMSLKV